MNNTKSSWLSRSSLKPDGYRVLIKQRHNHREKAQPRLTQSRVSGQSGLVEWKQGATSQGYTQMKDHIRKRMKTQCSDHFERNRLSTFSKGGEEDDKRTGISGSQQRKPCLDDEKQYASRSMNRINKVQPCKNSQFDSSSRKDDKPELQILEQRITSLLDIRLANCLQNSQKRDLKLELQLDEMILTLRNLKKDNPETIEADILYLDRKVKLFERLMAENITESQIMKDFYLSKVANRAKNNSSRHKTETFSPSKRLSLDKFCDTMLRSTIVQTSVSKTMYKPPNKTAYNIYKHSNTFFNADRHQQPMPRSSYNRQYLVKPCIPNDRYRPNNHNVLGKTTSHSMLNTSYQESFGVKRAEIVNYKDLDAFKDKIKSFSIPYGKRQTRSVSPNSYNIFLAKLNEEGKNKKGKEKKEEGKAKKVGPGHPFTSSKHPAPQHNQSKTLLTESRREYKLSESRLLTSEIKHSNFQKLKEHYLKKAH